ncbi:2-hydroxycyclohexanecarboxyl-CoA dehydrogenase [Novosphingobium sp. PhB165]|uniref:SDR family NAD(P)-dependent oxidoreductase n=1 Tax=Novosphingobium sp. PhB165 TaxID=2485105 RepID=UPI00104F3DC7|nr:SDR family NAD(P)-dependent oxidoreductase [Novosphingobium sp. PhB165]TCM20695.1 2-hydroxycyclohexanecarboxyl-CoA dehydrogenase [Novosphingobium sp. PhB165]
MSLEGKAAVVTGGARGLGRAIALRLAKDGVAVAVWDLNGAGAQETAQMIIDQGGKAIGLAADSSLATEIAAAANESRAALGPISILVNNAALSPFAKFEDLDEETWDRLMAINLKGPFLCVKEIVPDMLAQGWGRIINIASSSAQAGTPNQAHYAATKGGVLGFTKALAMEFATRGITVNAVPPGFVNTEGLQESPVDVEAYAPMTPMRRAGRPENIAAAVAFLASEDADYITGHTLSVNGGRYLN